jgi:hypothetical protein
LLISDRTACVASLEDQASNFGASATAAWRAIMRTKIEKHAPP